MISTKAIQQLAAAVVFAGAVLSPEPLRAKALDTDPCSEYDLCTAFAQLDADCQQDNLSNPEHQFCAWYVAGCYWDEGIMHWMGQCYDNGENPCPELYPCA